MCVERRNRVLKRYRFGRLVSVEAFDANCPRVLPVPVAVNLEGAKGVSARWKLKPVGGSHLFLAEEDLEGTVIVDHQVVRKCFHRLSLVILACVDAERCLRNGTEFPVYTVVVCVIDPRRQIQGVGVGVTPVPR